MNEAVPQYLVAGTEVLVVGHDGKKHRAKIVEAFPPRAARCESLDGKSSSISDYSETGETNTFSFPPSSKASEKAEKK
jgi:hypothetical protein